MSPENTAEINETVNFSVVKTHLFVSVALNCPVLMLLADVLSKMEAGDLNTTGLLVCYFLSFLSCSHNQIQVSFFSSVNFNSCMLGITMQLLYHFGHHIYHT